MLLISAPLAIVLYQTTLVNLTVALVRCAIVTRLLHTDDRTNTNRHQSLLHFSTPVRHPESIFSGLLHISALLAISWHRIKLANVSVVAVWHRFILYHQTTDSYTITERQISTCCTFFNTSKLSRAHSAHPYHYVSQLSINKL